MKRVTVIVSGLLASLMLAGAASAEPDVIRRPAEFNGPYMRVFGPSQPPYGYVRFCEQNPDECASRGTDTRFQATAERLSELDEINRQVNRAVQPATDTEIYGVSEYWTLPGERGDCEDYALLKQKLLIARGWPSSSLLLTVVRDEKGEGHAVLTARTSQGDFVLDNKIEHVMLWNKSDYEFVMRQSYLDPRVWVSLDPKDLTSPASLAGVNGVR
jgi:predicted transglutaminase-like cysteine proteinase